VGGLSRLSIEQPALKLKHLHLVRMAMRLIFRGHGRADLFPSRPPPRDKFLLQQNPLPPAAAAPDWQVFDLLLRKTK